MSWVPGTRRPRVAWLILTLCVTLPAVSTAHRLDEYLQATRVGIHRDRIELELDLTPGVAVAGQVLASIDADRNGEISDAEGAAYAARVLDSIALAVDGRPYSMTLTRVQVPSARDMSEGVGTIRLAGTARITPASAGRHQLVVRNTHRSDISVYLANALVPENAAVRITDQQRDFQQHELRIDFQVRPIFGSGALTRPIAAPVLAVTLLTTVAWIGYRTRRDRR